MKSTTLLIMRHAKSDWDSSIQRDYDRVLSKRGQKDAPRMGDWICKQGYKPDQTICSPAKRVRETILLAGDSWQLKDEDIVWDESLYNANLSHLLAVVTADLIPAKTNLLVAHNPGVSELILYLSGEQAQMNNDMNLMPTAAVYVLELTEQKIIADYGSWNIVNKMNPQSLP